MTQHAICKHPCSECKLPFPDGARLRLYEPIKRQALKVNLASLRQRSEVLIGIRRANQDDAGAPTVSLLRVNPRITEDNVCHFTSDVIAVVAQTRLE